MFFVFLLLHLFLTFRIYVQFALTSLYLNSGLQFYKLSRLSVHRYCILKDDASDRGIMVRALEDIISSASDSVEISYLQRVNIKKKLYQPHMVRGDQ
ncbi:hypothetical protein L1987_30563 [Smallanthus sonchifolius]|uniref:Uncharacterized protein n=1 Tax=Smallanthus sonchifolius TaxID=185202 RepID=A0ACB9I3V0_9ASTR|nr:hypothetical protein L1987_30563 [Smallanthus sonchifolius]